MASERAIATALAVLGEAFPTRDVTARTADVWQAIFADVADVDLAAATMRIARDPSRKFFPTSAEVFNAIASTAPPVDAGAILSRISKLGYYNPNAGWIYPRIETVREQLGDAIANAYATAGAERCFADDNSVTQDIARREFAAEIDIAQKKNPASPLLPPTPVKKITSGAA